MSEYSHAAKFTAAYVQGTHGYSFKDYLKNDPTIEALHMIAYSGDEATDRISAQREAVKLVGHISSLGFQAESDDSIPKALADITTLIKDGTKKASDLSAAVNSGFVFDDEVDQDEVEIA